MSTTNFKEFMAKVASDEQGYAFTVEEAEEELSEEALEGVAGGADYLKLGDIAGGSLDTTSTAAVVLLFLSTMHPATLSSSRNKDMF